MTKNELVEAIASKTELTKTDVDKVITSFADVITDALVKGDKVSLKGFGNFEVRDRSARTGRNPHGARLPPCYRRFPAPSPPGPGSHGHYS